MLVGAVLTTTPWSAKTRLVEAAAGPPASISAPVRLEQTKDWMEAAMAAGSFWDEPL